MGAGEKPSPFEKENFGSNVWEFQLFRGARRPLAFGRYRFFFIWAGLPRWVIELLDAGEKAGPFENENWVANVWECQLLHGAHRPLGFGRYRRGVGLYLVGSVPISY